MIIYNTKIGYNKLSDNYGYYLEKVPQNILDEIKKPIDKLEENFNSGKKYNDALAGEIEHEYNIGKPAKLNEYIIELSYRFNRAGQTVDMDIPLVVHEDCWVNFQRKHEYNPLHCHSGIFSFVIWYKIPYTFKDEEKYKYKNDKKICYNGQFVFYNIVMKGTELGIESNELGIDNEKEGYIAMFPSSLRHAVYPFYSSDDYRISVSGNVHFGM
jgi:hypothetical protein